MKRQRCKNIFFVIEILIAKYLMQKLSILAQIKLVTANIGQGFDNTYNIGPIFFWNSCLVSEKKNYYFIEEIMGSKIIKIDVCVCVSVWKSLKNPLRAGLQNMCRNLPKFLKLCTLKMILRFFNFFLLISQRI